ncbi:MAG: hypothetical protein Q9182_005822 [Xanthomendoza sp. 2 TL-2023]
MERSNKTQVNRNELDVIEAFKFIGVLRLAAMYPAMRFIFKLVEIVLRHNDSRGMTRSEIISTSRILLIAGSETTSSAVAAATYYLLRNPAMLLRAQTEIRRAFGKTEDITLRAVSSPGLLPYLEAVIKESLRCYPPIPATLPRKVGAVGAIIDAHFIPKDVSRFLPYAMIVAFGKG